MKQMFLWYRYFPSSMIMPLQAIQPLPSSPTFSHINPKFHPFSCPLRTHTLYKHILRMWREHQHFHHYQSAMTYCNLTWPARCDSVNECNRDNTAFAPGKEKIPLLLNTWRRCDASVLSSSLHLCIHVVPVYLSIHPSEYLSKYNFYSPLSPCVILSLIICIYLSIHASLYKHPAPWET